ncbi:MULTISPECIES: DUF7455 domain-containing protein [Actinomycetes]|uniref:DUF7455 domain-containing protein n=2 Tax=Actinomycetes TaxID=1760 RepID=A0ABP6LNJ4_9MICC|nr:MULTISPECIES: hypothetical protein [unclassified Nesterenkonia]MDS2171906.1 hypothetical protein [Nesterenkonia sp. CL21]OSM44791.1 hypothetical protein BCY76_000275 [Nesterenkonia sp. PF2B19]
MTGTTGTLEAHTNTLTALDRCDRCGAQAYVRAVLTSGAGDLLFCVHHARQVQDSLRPKTSEWVDESERLAQAR